eukprot:TRINITY_DN2868_c0_g1_i1.p2 TRINITY_DN2868_c0_g1~~TRINITY_DN2868_c0_g1_i1.p2  ORF type:complete len:132 (-),score=41.86 TRINITY_DN2868_c0_g1_i1:905-1300(-)
MSGESTSGAIAAHESRLAKLEEFFSSPELTSAIGDFGTRYACKFDPNVEEQSHEQYQIFQEYIAVVDAQLDAFLTKEGISTDDMFEACNYAKQEKNGASTCVDYLLACADYDNFRCLMYDFWELQDYSMDV